MEEPALEPCEPYPENLVSLRTRAILVESRYITASGKGIAPKNRINQGISQMIYSSEGISQKIA